VTLDPDFAGKVRPNLSQHCPSRKPIAKLGVAIRKFARQLRAEFAGEIERDLRAFRTHVVRFLRAELPLRRGRPCDAAITRAVEMRRTREPWHSIYLVCVPFFQRLDPYARHLAQTRLRSAVRSRRNARRRRKVKR